MADNFNISDIPPEAGPKSVEVPGDIADGVAGELLTWDAAGVAANVAAGTATDVLTSNGAGAAPTFQAGGGAPVASVFTRIGAVVAAASDYDASQVDNDSLVAGAFVDDALNTLAAAIPPAAPVDSVFARTGAVVAAASDYDASQVDNDSGVAGAFVDDALNNLVNAAVQARRTTTLTLATTFGDVTLDATDVESNAAIIDHEGATTDRITLVLAGLYEINYHFDVDPVAVTNSLALIEARVRVNDLTVLNGSEQLCSNWDDNSLEGNDHQDGLACSFLYQATAADFITLQAQYTQVSANDPTPVMGIGCTVTVKRIAQ